MTYAALSELHVRSHHKTLDVEQHVMKQSHVGVNIDGVTFSCIVHESYSGLLVHLDMFGHYTYTTAKVRKIAYEVYDKV